jgi:hypothetical protein
LGIRQKQDNAYSEDILTSPGPGNTIIVAADVVQGVLLMFNQHVVIKGMHDAGRGYPPFITWCDYGDGIASPTLVLFGVPHKVFDGYLDWRYNTLLDMMIEVSESICAPYGYPECIQVGLDSCKVKTRTF